MKKKLMVLLTAMTMIVSTLCTGCGGGSSSGGGGSTAYSKGHVNVEDKDGDGITEGGTFTVALGGDMVMFDPAYCYDMYGLPVINQVCECLLRYTLDKDGNIVEEPCLAESYEMVSPTEWKFKLRKGVKFSDGSDLTVEDVVWSLERMRKEAYAAQFYDNVDVIEATDDETVHITLKKPDATFQYSIAHQSGCAIMSKSYYESHKDTFGDPNTGCIGTGPYAFESWTQGEEIVLKRNENYWDKGAYFDKVVFEIIPESVTQVAGMQSGDINFIMPVPIDIASSVEGLKNTNMQVKDTFGVDFIAFNCSEAPFDDVNVRKAMNYLFDSKSFTEKICAGTGEQGYSGSIPKSLWVGDKKLWEEYESTMEKYEYNLDKAKECLKASAYPDGFTATITTDNNPIRYNSALYLQTEAAKIGVTIEIEKVSGEQLTARSFESPKNYQMLCNYWGSDYPDPIGLVGCLLQSKNKKGGSNFSDFDNKELDKLIESQDAMTDQNERAKVFIDALKIVDEECPWIMVDFANSTCAMSKDVTGYDVMGVWYLNDFTRLMHYEDK